MQTWDYIIVGAGSAGCVLANRLSADPSNRVLLLEAGPSDRSPYIHVPAALIKAVGNPRFDWCLLAEPDPTRYDKVDLWPAGRTLGGSSSINGMLYVRGAREDFDEWATLEPSAFCDEKMLSGYRRNEQLIDLTMIPDDVYDAVLSALDDAKPAARNRMFSYFVDKRLRQLTEAIGEF